jgi:mono/diheme cytochrome c family protein
MNKMFRIATNFSAIVLTSAFFVSCSTNEDSAGLEYMPDMYRSPSVEVYVDYGEVRGVTNEVIKNKLSALVPPKNTIPYIGTNDEDVMLMLPYKRKPSAAFATTHGLFGWNFTSNKEPDYEYNQAKSDVNPYKLTSKNSEEVFKKGKELYTAMCAHCHGEKGDGNGPMVLSGAYAGVPSYASRAELGDGQIFYSIYYGKGAMGSHASLVNKKEIWTLVHYIRKFQNADYGKFDTDGSMVSKKTTDSTTVKL